MQSTDLLQEAEGAVDCLMQLSHVAMGAGSLPSYHPSVDCLMQLSHIAMWGQAHISLPATLITQPATLCTLEVCSPSHPARNTPSPGLLQPPRKRPLASAREASLWGGAQGVASPRRRLKTRGTVT